ncbi:hypothetical protein BOTU111921_10900 [Bordetella tumbae]|uniref:hypothetical protein n=1 Tax=Bordetella tumbae TaxID=1649139 RepID=UPI0039F0F6A2
MELPSHLGVTPNAVLPTDSVSPVSQNLFEAMAELARDRHLTDLGQVGQALSGHLDSYLERTRSFSERVKQMSSGDPVYSDSLRTMNTGAERTDPRVMTVLQSLSVMFDYSIETQVVVRSATQVSGAVNTLLRGQ